MIESANVGFVILNTSSIACKVIQARNKLSSIALQYAVTIDNIPLSPIAVRNLRNLVRVSGDSQRLAKPDKRAPLDHIALSILNAFKLSHVVRGGIWEPKKAIRLAGGATVTR